METALRETREEIGVDTSSDFDKLGFSLQQFFLQLSHSLVFQFHM